MPYSASIERPLVDREPESDPAGRLTCDRVVAAGADHDAASSARSVTTRSAPDVGQPVGPDTAVDPDHQTEAAGPARLDAGQRVLEDHRPLDRHAELFRGVHERVRRRLAGQVLAGRDVAVDHDRRTAAPGPTPPAPAARCGRRTRRRSWCRARPGSRAAGPSPAYGCDALVAQHGGEEGVLPVAQPADRLGRGVVARVAVGQGDPTRGQERADAVVARLAVDVVEVVALDVGLVDDPPLGQEVHEQLLPGPHVHLGGRRQHPVKIEQCGVVVVPVHVDQAYDLPTRAKNRLQHVRPPRNLSLPAGRAA